MNYSGIAKPLTLAFILCGGKIDLFGLKIEMSGLVHFAIQLREFFVSEKQHRELMEEAQSIMMAELLALSAKDKDNSEDDS